MNWQTTGEAIDRMYAVKAGDEKFMEYLKDTHHELLKETLGRFLPVHDKGRILSIDEMRAQLDRHDLELREKYTYRVYRSYRDAHGVIHNVCLTCSRDSSGWDPQHEDNCEHNKEKEA